jgi:hypothetical protein
MTICDLGYLSAVVRAGPFRMSLNETGDETSAALGDDARELAYSFRSLAGTAPVPLLRTPDAIRAIAARLILDVPLLTATLAQRVMR